MEITYTELLYAYYDCRKNKRNTVNAIKFEMDMYRNLYKLLYELNSGTYEIGSSICFIVTKPTPREVFAANFRDRIVQHLVMNRINHLFEKYSFIDDAYACRVGKGGLYGISRLNEKIKQATNNYTKDAYIFKGDFKGFFMSIDKRILFHLLHDFLCKHSDEIDGDVTFTINLLKKIIFNMPQHNCIRKGALSDWNLVPNDKSLFNRDEYHGLPIGNVTSQILANFFLSHFDHFVIETLGIKHYGRYVDDFYCILNNKDDFKLIRERIKGFLSEMSITLHPKKCYIQHYSKGVKFIGAVVKPNRIYIGNRTKGNMYEKIKQFESKCIQGDLSILDLFKFQCQINSYLGFMKYYCTYKIRKKSFNMLISNAPICLEYGTPVTYKKYEIRKKYREEQKYYYTNWLAKVNTHDIK